MEQVGKNKKKKCNLYGKRSQNFFLLATSFSFGRNGERAAGLQIDVAQEFTVLDSSHAHYSLPSTGLFPQRLACTYEFEG